MPFCTLEKNKIAVCPKCGLTSPDCDSTHTYRCTCGYIYHHCMLLRMVVEGNAHETHSLDQIFNDKPETRRQSVTACSEDEPDVDKCPECYAGPDSLVISLDGGTFYCDCGAVFHYCGIENKIVSGEVHWIRRVWFFSGGKKWNYIMYRS